MLKYHADASQFVYKTTRRGVNATCPILKDGKAIATLDDVAERISADVTFTSEEERKMFLETAQATMPPNTEDHYAISEYARKITMDAEQQLLEDMKK